MNLTRTNKTTQSGNIRKAGTGFLLQIIFLILLGACSTTGINTSVPPPVVEQSSSGSTQAEDQGPKTEAEILFSNPAIQSLLKESANARHRGDIPQAISLIERAIRLEPKHAQLWLELAQLHLEALDFQAAEQVARKGLSFARESFDQVQRAWQIIATSLEATGNSEQAQNIRAYLKSL